MAEEEKEQEQEQEGRPSKLFMLLALVGLALIVMLTDWVMKLLMR